MDLISIPAACRARIADSRPLPGPLTRMSTERRPLSLATDAAAEAACCAAKGVPLREPLKPSVPALDQGTTLPSRSVIVTRVLLKEACTWAMPWTTCFFSFFLPFAGAAGLAVAICTLLLRRRRGLRPDHRPARALARARVRVRPLAADGQVPAVAHAA